MLSQLSQGAVVRGSPHSGHSLPAELSAGSSEATLGWGMQGEVRLQRAQAGSKCPLKVLC